MVNAVDDPLTIRQMQLIIGTQTIFLFQSELLGKGNSLTVGTIGTNGEYSRRSIDDPSDASH